MSTPTLVRLRGLLYREKSLAVLLPEAERLQGLNQRFAGAVPAALSRLCQVGALRDGTATVYCRHGAAAARVRSLAASVAAALHSDESPVRQVRVKVRADWARPSPAEKPGLDHHALDAWGELAGTLPDGPLRQAVGRLLRHHRP